MTEDHWSLGGEQSSGNGAHDGEGASISKGREQQGEIARIRQPLVIKKRGSYTSIHGELTT